MSPIYQFIGPYKKKTAKEQVEEKGAKARLKKIAHTARMEADAEWNRICQQEKNK